ncbi:hypothetical protein [Streptomyces sp. NPDC002082]|uniref:hypothetical protein n=1 Tax=Streptomyces sp. NPDC002082 TaxID=3154772 RepID=UPI003317EA04
MEATREGAILVKGVWDMPSPSAVHVRDKKTGQRVATVSKFRLESHPDGAPEWDLISEPLKLSALGIYTLEVGSESDHIGCGDFDYRLRSETAGLGAQGKVSLDSLKTTVSADLTAFDPRTQTSAPLKNTKVSLTGEGIAQEFTTDAQGRLATPVTFRGTEKSTLLHVGVQATPEMDGEDKYTAVPTVRQKAEIELDPASQKIRALYGSTAKLTGRAVIIAADGTRKPVPEGTLLNGDLDGKPGTGADGRFERVVRVAPTRSPVITTSWAYDLKYPWLAPAHGFTQVDLIDTTSFTQFGATIDAARRVTFTGGLTRQPNYGYVDVEVQYSADGKTDWKTRKVFSAYSGKVSEFKQTLPGEADGYWRLHYPGTANIQPATTKPVRLTRTATAFSYFNAAPEPVRKGQAFTIKGTLQHGTPAKAYAGQTVQFYFRPAGSQDFLPQGQAKTAADGTFLRKFTADRTGTWIARYRDADGKHFNAESRQDDLAVNP